MRFGKLRRTIEIKPILSRNNNQKKFFFPCDYWFSYSFQIRLKIFCAKTKPANSKTAGQRPSNYDQNSVKISTKIQKNDPQSACNAFVGRMTDFKFQIILDQEGPGNHRSLSCGLLTVFANITYKIAAVAMPCAKGTP